MFVFFYLLLKLHIMESLMEMKVTVPKQDVFFSLNSLKERKLKEEQERQTTRGRGWTTQTPTPLQQSSPSAGCSQAFQHNSAVSPCQLLRRRPAGSATPRFLLASIYGRPVPRGPQRDYYVYA